MANYIYIATHLYAWRSARSAIDFAMLASASGPYAHGSRGVVPWLR